MCVGERDARKGLRQDSGEKTDSPVCSMGGSKVPAVQKSGYAAIRSKTLMVFLLRCSQNWLW